MRRHLLRVEGDDGFTLIELLVVIIIIGILSAIAIPAYLNQRQKAWRTAAVQDMKNASTAVESMAINDQGSYALAHGLDETSPQLKTEGFNRSQWVDIDVVADTIEYCIRGTNVHYPGKVFIFRSESGVVDLGDPGVLNCT